MRIDKFLKGRRLRGETLAILYEEYRNTIRAAVRSFYGELHPGLDAGRGFEMEYASMESAIIQSSDTR